MSVRVRYAPSPTGMQHIGGARTAIFNYLFARAQGGSFILRLEDTDRTRYSDEAVEDLFATMQWLGMDADEGPRAGGAKGPYVQSERIEMYQRYAEQLVSDGYAYRCYCSSERLEQLREEQLKSKASRIGYDGHCRSLSAEDRASLEAEGKTFVIRFIVPTEGETSFQDLLMGEITRKNSDISPDPIMLKADGFPTYHLANVIDDHAMEITHILRAQEWVPSGPLHILLYKAFGWTPPKYCHLPMVMGSDGQKLSKRHGSTSVKDFRAAGYLPDALFNYVTLVGWSLDGETEFFSKEELEKVFSLERINTASGVFDYKKLQWFNGQYIRSRSIAQLAAELEPFMADAGVKIPAEEVALLTRERLKLLSDVGPLMAFLEPHEVETADLMGKIKDPAIAREVLIKAREVLAGPVLALLAENEKRTAMSEDPIALREELELKCFEPCKAIAEEMELKVGLVMQPIRVAVTGYKVSPPLFGSIVALGMDEVLRRVDLAIAQLS